MPLKELKAIGRVSIPAHDARRLTFSIPLQQLHKWDLAAHAWKVYPGNYKLVLGSDSRNEKLVAEFTLHR